MAQGGEDWGRVGAKGSGTRRQAEWREAEFAQRAEATEKELIAATFAGKADEDLKKAVEVADRMVVERCAQARRTGRHVDLHRKGRR